jgi:hypothetical protein
MASAHHLLEIELSCASIAKTFTQKGLAIDAKKGVCAVKLYGLKLPLKPKSLAVYRSIMKGYKAKDMQVDLQYVSDFPRSLATTERRNW